ncbi:MAG: hypothetical protein Kow0069_36980 [Promethearchaeota archaeon]
MSEQPEERKCPYCGVVLSHPYWKHLSSEHPEEFASDRQNWVNLFHDYTAVAGMPKEISVKVIAELYNVSEQDVEEFLKHEGKL